ncbi:MAG TPA: protein-L-isoaspartate O-methyltransferase, partial [Aquabacterium sp.]|nr:protein-L-isoaspartate O-methyltransferase [Aquabacterium sp.]
LAAVKREDFIPAAHRAQAFTDIEIPLEGGRSLLAPRVEARLVQDLNLSKRDTVLQIGTGTGYVTALLAHKAQRVVALDSDANLVTAARANLRQAGISNAEVVHNDGSQGYVGQDPYDAIVLTGSVAEVPQVLLDQLKVGGRLLAVVGQEPMMQATLITRVNDTQFSRQALFDTVIARLPGFAEASRFAF